MSTLTIERNGDVAFMCTPDHAVEVAYLMSTAEGAVMRKCDRFDVMEIMFDYIDGNLDIHEAIDELSKLEDGVALSRRAAERRVSITAQAGTVQGVD